jgi:excisionase family DNA binding protein
MSIEHAPQQEKRRGAFSVAEFCAAFNVSAPLFYKLLNAGQAPDTFLVGKRRLISYEAAQRWVRARERAERQQKEPV